MNVSPARIAASLVILSALQPIRASAQPVLSVNPTTVSMAAEVGQPLPNRTVQVRNAGTRALKWSVTTEQFTQSGLTLTVSPTSGTNAGTLTVSVSYTSSVVAGNYAAAFVVSASGNTPQRVPVSVVLTGSSPPPPPPDGWTFCANENGFCGFSGTKDVRYGANNTYASGTFTDGVACTNAVFGDPIAGVAKHCDVKDATTPPPAPRLTGGRSARTRTAFAASAGPKKSATAPITHMPSARLLMAWPARITSSATRSLASRNIATSRMRRRRRHHRRRRRAWVHRTASPARVAPSTSFRQTTSRIS